MKSIVRALVLGVFVAGASAAVATSHAPLTASVSHQVVAASMPTPSQGCPVQMCQ